MSTNGATRAAFEPVIQPFVDVWSDYVKQANETTRELFDGFEDGSDIKSWQRRWMNAISQSMDAYMRTPAFLEAMKHNTDVAVQLKRQADDLASEAAHNANLPTAGDISGLFERLHSVEEVILKRLELIDERLELLEVQLRNRQPTI